MDIQTASQETLPAEAELRKWIGAALMGRTTRKKVEVSVRLVDQDEMAQLNANYRGKKGATNVLSFPAHLPKELDIPLLGDIVICAPVVGIEAAQQGKSQSAHWAHMAVHGTLHLLGYDHIEDKDAKIMEALESSILEDLNYPSPYNPTQSCESLL
ncbi:MAG: rRNA maturation RNase YbeY [Halioglobus sp.]|nr:rRNA maturation RNase YbeY [Halioglobus sp.]